MGKIIFYLKESYTFFKEKYKSKEFKIQIFFLCSILSIFSFSYLTLRNPLNFLLPFRLYPLSMITKKTIYYYTYERETKQLVEIQKEMYFSEDWEQNLLRIAQIIQQPEPYLRSYKKRIKETVYFPWYSLGITKVWFQDSILYIDFDESILNQHYQRENSLKDFDFKKKFLIAFFKTIFKNFTEIQEIHWIENEKEIVVSKN
ncbi:MAG: hypothetical protein ACK4UJ_00320 [Leptonema sp. (in: bacteria)]